MARTAEQIAADDGLTAAIEAVQRAYHDVEGVLTTYIVMAKRKWWDEDGDPFVGYYRLTKDDDVPLDEQLGLIGYADTRVRKMIAEGD